MGLWDRESGDFIAPDKRDRTLSGIEAAPNGEWLDVAIHWTPEKRESDWEFIRT